MGIPIRGRKTVHCPECDTLMQKKGKSTVIPDYIVFYCFNCETIVHLASFGKLIAIVTPYLWQGKDPAFAQNAVPTHYTKGKDK